jgi:hypothetical protein
MKYSLDDVFTFGKYYGMTLKEVANLEPEYIYVHHKNNKDFIMDEDAAIYCLKQLTLEGKAILASADPTMYGL